MKQAFISPDRGRWFACKCAFIRLNALWVVEILFGGFWNYRDWVRTSTPRWWKRCLYFKYLEYYGSFIGLNTEFADVPVFPHGIFGVFISEQAKIGSGCTIFHHVTIGSNTIEGTKHGVGAPVIGNDVFVGANASIIGNIRVGDRVRVGANCIVADPVPDNAVIVIGGVKVIQKTTPVVNKYVKIGDIVKGR